MGTTGGGERRDPACPHGSIKQVKEIISGPGHVDKRLGSLSRASEHASGKRGACSRCQAPGRGKP